MSTGGARGLHPAGSTIPVPLPSGLATSIGSLPHCDPSEAVDFVLRYQPRLPAAPSLPARSPLEGMVAQAATSMKGVMVAADGSIIVDVEALDPDDPLTHCRFSGEAFGGLRAFLSAVSDRSGPIKLQLTGPITLGVALHASGAPAPLAFRVASSAVQVRAAALMALLAERVPQCTPVVFLDEPGLTGALDRDFPLGPSAVLELLAGALGVLGRGAVTGVHCCGPTDLALVMQAGARILSLPTDTGVEQAGGALAQFLERGGWVAWGAVPTDRPLGTTSEMLWRELSWLWCRLVQDGCDPVKLRAQAMITPACGLAGHGVPQAEQVMQFTNELARRLHDQAIGVRLSVGA